MKRRIICLAAFLGLIAASCGSPEKMKDSADQISVACEPKVLEAHAGVINAKITVSFPEKYFNTSAILEMLPVLKFEGTEMEGTVKILQGEKVKDNYTVIAEKGGSYTQDVQFTFDDSKMRKASLEIRPTLVVKDKRIPFPADIKAADGVVATYKLAEIEVKPAFLQDSYTQVIAEEKRAQIMFLVNQSNVRSNQLKREDVKELEKFIADAGKEGSNTVIKNVTISSYASPEGPLQRNEALSVERGKAASTTLNSAMKRSKVKLDKSVVEMEHTAEDWDGFQELVAASDIQDKELILRVLSMYSDPTTREQELRNMSKVFRILEDKVLPELRRSVMIAKVQVANYTDDELKAMVNANNIESLDTEALLYAATLYNDLPTKTKLYKKAADKYGDDRAYTNLAGAYLAQGDVANAKAAVNSIKNKNVAAAKNNQGLVALADGIINNASQLFNEAGSLAPAKQNAGIVAIDKGMYDAAASALAGTGTFNEALALVLTDKLDAADRILANLDTGKASYLRAVIAARKGNASNVSSYLNAAYAKDASLKARAQNDIEFAKFASSI
jgi:hypothetical protein